MREDKYAHEMVSPIADSTPPPPPPPPSQSVAAQGSGLSRRARRTIIAVVVIVIVLIGIIGYAAAGLAFATTRVAIADKSLNSVISHQNSLTNTFKDIDKQFNALSNSAFDPIAARTLYDQLVTNAKSAGTMVDKDDASLVSANASLKEQQWLTAFSRGNLDKEAARIDHARKALSIAKTLAAAKAQDGEFFQPLMDTFVDTNTFGTQMAQADLASAKGTLTTMKTHVDKALDLSTAPGLTSDLHSLMVDLETLVADFGKLLDAVAANNDKAIISAETAIEADATKVGTYNFDKIVTDLGAYYQPLVDNFNSEMAKATAS